MSDNEQMTEENIIKNEPQEYQEVRPEESQRENLAKNLYKDYKEDNTVQGSTKAQSTIKKEQQIEKKEEKNIIQGPSEDLKMPLDPSYKNEINDYLEQPKELDLNQKEMIQESNENEIEENHTENNNTQNYNNEQVFQYQEIDFDQIQEGPKEDDDDVLREYEPPMIYNTQGNNRSELVNSELENQNRNEFPMLFDNFENNEIVNNYDGLLNFFDNTHTFTNGNNG